MKIRGSIFRTGVSHCAFTLLSIGFCGPVFAQVEQDDWLSDVALEFGDAPTEASLAAESSGVFVDTIAIVGSEAIPPEAFDRVIEPYVGRALNEEDMRKLTQEIADSARENGYIFASARIPQQRVKDGRLQVELNEGRIDEVRIIGSDNRALYGTLHGLTGRYAKKSDVERALALANDIPDIRVQKSRFITEDGVNILEVRVTEKDDRFAISADNYGSDRFGPLRARFAYSTNALLFGSDTASIAMRNNPVDPEEFAYFSANYEVGIGHNGTRVGVAASTGQTQPGSTISGLDNIQGDSRFLSAQVSHPVIRGEDHSVWINADAAYLTIEQDALDTLLRSDTQVTFSVGVSANNRVLGGRLRSGVTVTRGAGILGTTRAGDPLASRFDGDGVFTKGAFFVNWSGTLFGNVGLYVGGYGQIADRALLASQEISVGGAFSARGFDFGEVSGETGFVGMAELNYTFKKPTPWLKRLQPYAFIDGGYVDNKGAGYGDGSLLSGGLGMRANVGPFSLEVEGALPLNRDREKSGDRSPNVNVYLGMDI